MFPTYVSLKARLAESTLLECRQENVRYHLSPRYDCWDQPYDLTRPAFPRWRTVVQAAFAIAITMAMLLVIFASIAAITRA